MPASLAPELVAEIRRLHADGHTIASVAAILDIGTATASRYAPSTSTERARRPPRPSKPPAGARSWPTDWHDDAACRTVHDSRFLGHTADARELRREYCAHCPVISQCWHWAEADTGFEGVAADALWTGPIRGKRKASVA
jgi:hypothetical protein